MKNQTPTTTTEFQKDVLLAIREALDKDVITTSDAFAMLELLRSAKNDVQFRMITKGLAEKYTFLAVVFDTSAEIQPID